MPTPQKVVKRTIRQAKVHAYGPNRDADVDDAELGDAGQDKVATGCCGIGGKRARTGYYVKSAINEPLPKTAGAAEAVAAAAAASKAATRSRRREVRFSLLLFLSLLEPPSRGAYVSEPRAAFQKPRAARVALAGRSASSRARRRAGGIEIIARAPSCPPTNIARRRGDRERARRVV